MTRLARPAPPAPRQLLARILEEPALVAALQSLEGRVLGKLISAVGLEDSGELCALATAEQLREVLDEDLWQSERPGADEQFDAERFARWLEVMLEAGEEVVARRILELPVELVTLGLHRQLLVVDFDALSVSMAESQGAEHDLTEKAIEGSLYHELGPYAVFSKRHEGWDAVLALLLALDRDHHAFLERLLARLCALSEAQIEESGGLHRLLTGEETLEVDAAAEREDRRASEGYLAPSAALSFLALARQTPLEELGAAGVDPIEAAYFRGLRGARQTAPAAERAPSAGPEGPTLPRDPSGDRLRAILVEGELLEADRPALLGEGRQATAALFREALGALRERGAVELTRRMAELGFLANALSAGASRLGRRLRGLEAAELVVAACNLGLEHRLGRALDTPRARAKAEELLEHEGAVKLFRLGWRRLHELSLAACGALAEALDARAREARGLSPERELARLAFAAGRLREAAASHRPWLARPRLAELPLDPGARAALEGLLDECPALAGPLSPEAEGAAIATGAELARARAFLASLALVR